VLVAALVGLWFFVLAWIVRAYRVLYFEAPLTASVFVRACERYLRAGDLRGERALVEAGRTAWLARLYGAVLEGRSGPGVGGGGIEELAIDLRDSGERLLRPLRGFASLAASLGMLFAILSLNGVGVPKGGLLALQAGLVQTLSLEQALSCFAVGGATSGVALASVTALRRQLAALQRDLDVLMSVVDDVAAHQGNSEL